jgi:hypothetical protein
MLILSILAACEGPVGDVGPRGPQGPPGLDGVNIESFVFEYGGINFTDQNGYTVILPYADDFVALPSDVTLVYFLWDQVEINGELEDVWRALPQSVFTEDGTIQYTYDFTRYDFQLYLNTNFNPDFLLPVDTDDWIVRAVVVPGSFFSAGGRMQAVDLDDYYAVMEAMGTDYKPAVHEYNNGMIRR